MNTLLHHRPGHGGHGRSEPGLAELTAALQQHVDEKGELPAGVAAQLAAERGWGGRLIEVLGLITETAEEMGYLTGGRHPSQVLTWLPVWAGSPLSLEEIRLVIASGGWDPDPFVTLANAGLLEEFLRAPDGSARRVRGELAGRWASEQLALADDEEVLEAARWVIGTDKVPQPGPRPPERRWHHEQEPPVVTRRPRPPTGRRGQPR
jgi:hypothetical protein